LGGRYCNTPNTATARSSSTAVTAFVICIIIIFPGSSQRFDQIKVIANSLGQSKERMIREEKGDAGRITQRLLAFRGRGGGGGRRLMFALRTSRVFGLFFLRPPPLGAW
jgi:hypothetical protein